MAWAIACCGCGRMLGIDGTLVGPKTGGGGYRGFADFETKEQADAAATKAGWSVKDEDGPNHRCPECALSHRAYAERRGAYIEVL